MKIGIPANEKSMASNVSSVFGRARYFLIYDVESQERRFMENSAIGNPGGAGVKAAQLMVDNDVEIVLAPRCGENAAQVFDKAGIKTYQTVSASLQDNLKAYLREDLELLDGSAR